MFILTLRFHSCENILNKPGSDMWFIFQSPTSSLYTIFQNGNNNKQSFMI